MDIRIIKRHLSDKELDILINEIKKFYSPVIGYKDKWKKFHTVYIATLNNDLAGVCGVEKVNNWLMLHPFVVLEKYHGRRIGSLIMKNLLKDNSLSNIFIGSQNPAVEKIAMSSGFRKVANLHTLPIIVKLYLLKFFIDSLNFAFIKEFLRKRSIPHGHFSTYIKLHNN